MTTIYRGTVLFAGGGETVEGSTVDVRGAGEVKLGVLGSDIETVHRAELRTIVTRPDPKDPGVFEESGKITVDDMDRSSSKPWSRAATDPRSTRDGSAGTRCSASPEGTAPSTAPPATSPPTSRSIRTGSCTTPSP